VKILWITATSVVLAACSSTGDVPAQRPTSDFSNASHIDCTRIAQNINHGVNDQRVQGACGGQPDKSAAQ
jgi:hypothetical protein